MDANLSLQKATEADIPAMATCFLDAFLGNDHPQTKYFHAVFPRTPATHEFFVQSYIGQMQREKDSVFLKVVDTSAGNKLAGYVKWEAPTAGPTFWADTSVDADPLQSIALFAAMEAGRKKLMGDRPHWHIDVLAVDPQYARKGIASALLGEGCRLVDKDGVEAFVESSPLASPLYQRYGFVLQDTVSMPSPYDWYHEHFLVRPKSK